MADEYESLQIAALLRKLLVDEVPLVHQVNQKRRVKIVFAVAENPQYAKKVLEDRPLVYFVMDGIYPGTGIPNSTVQRVKLDALLKWRAAAIKGQSVSVKDLIQHLANVAGGVHAGKAREEKDRQLISASNLIRVGGMTAVGRTMWGITEVVLDGLAPLERHIKDEYP